MTQKHLSPTLTLSLSLLLLSGSMAVASPPTQQVIPGMKHMQVAPNKPPQAPPAAPVPATAPPVAEVTPITPVVPGPQVQPPPPAPSTAKKTLSVQEAVIKPEDLKPWPHLADIVNIPTREAALSIMQSFESEPGLIPPQALLFLAKGLAEQKLMEEAAVYYYVAQLRLSFDIARWPPRLDEEQIARILAEKKKTADQAAAMPPPKIKNPHESVAMLAAGIGAPITQWMLQDPSRADRVMARVKVWDESAPYAYLPGYDLPQALPYEEWVKMLPNIRAGFYGRMNEFIAGLKRVKGQ